MKWWLTVFFLIGNDWISGDNFDGWGSRAYMSRQECEQRRFFAETQTAKFPLDTTSVWVCNQGEPATRPPPPILEALQQRSFAQTSKSGGRAQITLRGLSTALHPGLSLFTHENQPWIKEDAIGLRFIGPLTPPFAENLRDLLLRDPHTYDHVVLELDSPGGELGYVKEIVAVLAEVKKRATVVTRVMGAQVCASGCVAVYLQGAKRKASGASVWIFH